MELPSYRLCYDDDGDDDYEYNNGSDNDGGADEYNNCSDDDGDIHRNQILK